TRVRNAVDLAYQDGKWVPIAYTYPEFAGMLENTRHEYAVAHPDVDESKGYAFLIRIPDDPPLFAVVFGHDEDAVMIPAYDRAGIGPVDVAEPAAIFLSKVLARLSQQ